MLRALDPNSSPHPVAYRVPWRIVRADRAHPTLINAGGEEIDFVRVFRRGAVGDERVAFRGHALPGEQIEVCLCEIDPDETAVTVAWFRRRDGAEYIWRFVV